MTSQDSDNSVAVVRGSVCQHRWLCAGPGARLFQTRREAGLGPSDSGSSRGESPTIGDIEKGGSYQPWIRLSDWPAPKVRASWLAFGDGENYRGCAEPRTHSEIGSRHAPPGQSY